MKILYISNTFMAKGLDVTVLFELAPHMRKTTLFDIDSKIDKTEIVPAEEIPELKIYDGYLNLSQVYVSKRSISTSRSLAFYRQAWQMKRFIKKGRYDVVHAINFLGSARAFIYKCFSPWVTTVHDPIPHSDSKDRKKKDKTRVKLLSLSEGIVLLNGNQKDEFCEKYKVSQEKILLNRLGIYDCMNLFAPKDACRNPYNVLFFGNIRPYKGLEYLCKAMRKVKEIFHRPHLPLQEAERCTSTLNHT